MQIILEQPFQETTHMRLPHRGKLRKAPKTAAVLTKERCILEQQDLEEYFRLILNKVATKLDGSDILQLYLSCSLMCLKCHAESSEGSLFLDIPLPIQPFSSVEKSFEEFLKAEILNGSNICFCEEMQSEN